MRKTTLPKRNWREMTTWMPTHAPNPQAIRSRSALNYSRAMHADHPWDVTLTSRLFPIGSLIVVRTTVSPTPHARIPHDLRFPSLITRVWLGNHLFRSIFTIGLPRPEASTPCLDVAPSSAPLICEPTKTLARPANLPVDLAFGAPP